MALKKLCSKCGILISISEKYCEKCTEKYLEDKKISNKLYDKQYRNKRSTEFYHSKEWNIVRQQAIQRDNGLCKLCLSNKKIKSMDIVHHIEEIKDNYSKRLDIDNIICLCSSCHNTVHTWYSTNNKEEIQRELRRLLSG